MSSLNRFLKVGAWICLFFGLYIAGIDVMIFATGHTKTASTAEALGFAALMIYPFFAALPFYTFVYPKFKLPRKSVLTSVALAEIVVIGLFLLAALFPHL
jgi:hypothetical protein